VPVPSHITPRDGRQQTRFEPGRPLLTITAGDEIGKYDSGFPTNRNLVASRKFGVCPNERTRRITTLLAALLIQWKNTRNIMNSAVHVPKSSGYV
jgi:hypothetical protein